MIFIPVDIDQFWRIKKITPRIYYKDRIELIRLDNIDVIPKEIFNMIFITYIAIDDITPSTLKIKLSKISQINKNNLRNINRKEMNKNYHSFYEFSF